MNAFRMLFRLAVLSSFCLLICVGIMGSAAAQVSQPVDPSWEKSADSVVASPFLLPLITDPIVAPDTNWTTFAWSGPSQNGFGADIPNYVPGDYWAMWNHEGLDDWDTTKTWFRTTVNVCDASRLVGVRVFNKYPGNAPSRIISINDDLYLFVNGQPAAAGGTAAHAGMPVDPGFASLYHPASRATVESGIAVETDRWYIAGGFNLSPDLFQTGENEILIMTDEFRTWGGLGHLVFEVTLDGPCPLEVGIDIRPGSYPNCFNWNGHGMLPVAVLGSATCEASDVDPGSLSLQGLPVATKGNGGYQCHFSDVNGDGYIDLVCQFADSSGTFNMGVSTAILTGQLWDGTSISGSDEICFVANPRRPR